MGINILHKPEINFKQMNWFNRFIVFCGVGFGSGLAPKAPGTFGSAFALLFIPLWLAIGFSSTIVVIILMSLVGIYICGQTAKVMGVRLMAVLSGMNLQDNRSLFYPFYIWAK